MSDCKERAANNFTHQQKKQHVEPGERKPQTLLVIQMKKVGHKVSMMSQLLLLKKASEGNIYLKKNRSMLLKDTCLGS